MSDDHTSMTPQGDRSDGDGRPSRTPGERTPRRDDDNRGDSGAGPPRREPRYLDGDLLHG
jgi:hypothetical protein